MRAQRFRSPRPRFGSVCIADILQRGVAELFFSPEIAHAGDRAGTDPLHSLFGRRAGFSQSRAATASRPRPRPLPRKSCAALANSMPSNRTFLGNPRMGASTYAASGHALWSIPSSPGWKASSAGFRLAVDSPRPSAMRSPVGLPFVVSSTMAGSNSIRTRSSGRSVQSRLAARTICSPAPMVAPTDGQSSHRFSQPPSSAGSSQTFSNA
jgi:hypothetical protein